jgi:hypothetical protein
VQDGYAAAKLRAAYLVQAYPEIHAGMFWYRGANDLLTLALHASADEQGVAVSDADLAALRTRLTETDVNVWLAEPAARLGLRTLGELLAGLSRTRESVVLFACAVLDSHRPVPEADLAADTELAELIGKIQGHDSRLGDHELVYQADDRLRCCAHCGVHEAALRDRATGRIRACVPPT